MKLNKRRTLVLIAGSAIFTVVASSALAQVPALAKARLLQTPSAASPPAPKALPTAVVPSAKGVQSYEPKWPQAFALSAGESSGFGFLVGQPGPITVSLRWTGGPLIVSLRKPGGEAIERQGDKQLEMVYQASAADVTKGSIWSISIRSVNTGASGVSQGAQLHNKPIAATGQTLASGEVLVTHPVADLKQTQAELQTLAQSVVRQSSSGRIMPRLATPSGTGAVLAAPSTKPKPMLVLAPGKSSVQSASAPSAPNTPAAELETRILDQNTVDRAVRTPFTFTDDDAELCHPACRYGVKLEYLLFGARGDDEYYRNSFLKNGWVVDSAYLVHVKWQNGVATELLGPSRTDHADAYIASFKPGSNSPYANVHWWYDAGGNSTGYLLRIVIKGPKGLAHF